MQELVTERGNELGSRQWSNKLRSFWAKRGFFFLTPVWLCSIMHISIQPRDAIIATHTRRAEILKVRFWCCPGVLLLSQQGISLKLCLSEGRRRAGLEVRLTNGSLLLGHDTPSRAEAWPCGGPFWHCWRHDLILARLRKPVAMLITDHGLNSRTWVELWACSVVIMLVFMQSTTSIDKMILNTCKRALFDQTD